MNVRSGCCVVFCSGITYPAVPRPFAAKPAASTCASLNPTSFALSVVANAAAFVPASSLFINVFDSTASSSFNFFSFVLSASFSFAPAFTNSR